MQPAKNQQSGRCSRTRTSFLLNDPLSFLHNPRPLFFSAKRVGLLQFFVCDCSDCWMESSSLESLRVSVQRMEKENISNELVSARLPGCVLTPRRCGEFLRGIYVGKVDRPNLPRKDCRKIPGLSAMLASSPIRKRALWRRARRRFAMSVLSVETGA